MISTEPHPPSFPMRIALFVPPVALAAASWTTPSRRPHVRALVRDPAKLAPRAGLEIIQGDVLDAEAVARVVAGQTSSSQGLGRRCARTG